MRKIRILLIEDNRLLRDGIIALLCKDDGFYVITSSRSTYNTAAKIRLSKPDIIILDLGLRNQNSLKIIETARKDFPKSKVIVMDLLPAQEDINLFARAGVSGFILKDASSQSFISTIRAVAGGDKVVPPDHQKSMLSYIIEQAVKEGKKNLSSVKKMSGRELEVIRFISDGLSNIEIGKRMHVSPHTIKSHIHKIMDKLALRTRLEVAMYVYSAKKSDKS